jgi:sulfite reductase alpha subunit-like flavoprotein
MNMRNYSSSVPCKIKSIRQLRQKTDQGSTIEIIFDLTGTGIKYITASNFAMYAENKSEDVASFAEQHGLKLDTKFTLSKNPEYSGRAANTPFPIQKSGITLKEVLTKFIDIYGPVSKKFIKELIPLCEA